MPYIVDLEVLLDFRGVEHWEELRSLTLWVNGYKSFLDFRTLAGMISPGLYQDIMKAKPFEDSLYLEELSYRARVYVVTNLPKVDAKSLLLRNNLDVFVQDVVSAEEVRKYLPSRELLDYAVRRANSVIGATTFLTSSLTYALASKELGMKVYVMRGKYKLPENFGISQVTGLGKLAEATAKKGIDGSMGDSALRCT